MKFIEKDNQAKVYTDFADELTGEIEEVDIVGSIAGLETYNQRVASFIRKHANYIAISKIKNNEPISSEELEQLKQLLFIEDPDAAKHLDEVLGDKDLTQFIRTIIGLDAKAAKAPICRFHKSRRHKCRANKFHGHAYKLSNHKWFLIKRNAI